MLKKLTLHNFKNFLDATLSLGSFTILLGANASGKSNIRDAFRFLHGISRGYTLAEIIGEKYIEGGVLQWRGIRGGTLEATFQKAPTFDLSIDFDIVEEDQSVDARYQLEVEPGISPSTKPRVVRESLHIGEEMLYDSHPIAKTLTQDDIQHLSVRIPPGGKFRKGQVEKFISNQPVLTQIEYRLEDRNDRAGKRVRRIVRECIASLSSMRFVDLNPDAMRNPSFPGQTILGDRGENLSSVMQAIVENSNRKAALTEWIKELTPMDAAGFEFPTDQTGRILLTLLEENGQKTSAFSASDGTLRFLGMIAALLGPDPARFYFFEELENGIHPVRIHLLLELIEREAKRGNIQIIATTHSPQVLNLVSHETLEDASIIYRLPGSSDAHIRNVLNLPEEGRKVIEQQGAGRLYETGWFDNVIELLGKGEE